MECPRPIKSVLSRFYPTWSSQTSPSMRIQRSEGLGSSVVLNLVICPSSCKGDERELPIVDIVDNLSPVSLLKYHKRLLSTYFLLSTHYATAGSES